ncbi:hypothetical protein QE152_g8979 [Popillia japonica]|uniref:Uncharacterized protein n=1 Tax=Popillia japonica TaxID=7064 RepID=A0AAW1M3W7_POPJA
MTSSWSPHRSPLGVHGLSQWLRHYLLATQPLLPSQRCELQYFRDWVDPLSWKISESIGQMSVALKSDLMFISKASCSSARQTMDGMSKIWTT